MVSTPPLLLRSSRARISLTTDGDRLPLPYRSGAPPPPINQKAHVRRKVARGGRGVAPTSRNTTKCYSPGGDTSRHHTARHLVSRPRGRGITPNPSDISGQKHKNLQNQLFGSRHHIKIPIPTWGYLATSHFFKRREVGVTQ